MSTRDDIVAAARGEQDAVNDVGGEDGNKKGWERLKQYFEAALGDDDIFARGQSYVDGIKKANQFVSWTDDNGEHHLDWCGLFCVWALRQANIDSRWVIGRGPEGRIRDAGPNGDQERPPRTDWDNLQPGDILVRNPQTVHHCIVTAFDGTNISTMNGNWYYQGVAEVTDEAWSGVDKSYFYSIDDYPGVTS
jgi:hypothetical protein